uniref:Uncharacterized protein n=1 Tax=Arundo donax TaxID=35708 RepID=A0A0A8ZQG1_ARUDO
MLCSGPRLLGGRRRRVLRAAAGCGRAGDATPRRAGGDNDVVAGDCAAGGSDAELLRPAGGCTMRAVAQWCRRGRSYRVRSALQPAPSAPILFAIVGIHAQPWLLVSPAAVMRRS